MFNVFLLKREKASLKRIFLYFLNFDFAPENIFSCKNNSNKKLYDKCEQLLLQQTKEIKCNT